ncbi:MAG: hypothetical protein EBX49_12690 [Synechococcaceae bacterium WB8_1B_136]|nr:hypothetical protein [Synechococcaceae bacterium WB8_1B_136]
MVPLDQGRLLRFCSMGDQHNITLPARPVCGGLARTLNVKQAEISKIENRANLLMSTLLNFVQAMGGDLEVRAVFPDRAIAISTFSSLAGKPAKGRTRKKKKLLIEA